MNGKKTILVLGANPAWQHVSTFERLTPGKINRACESLCFPSGKGINFCRAAQIHGRADTRLFQFVGGRTGRLLTAGLDEEKFHHTDIETAGNSRTCITCRDTVSGQVTELIEPSGAADETQVDAMLAAIRNALPESGLLVVCGTLPPGTPQRLYAEVAELAVTAGVPLLIDSFHSIEPMLSLTTGRTILKINREELEKLTGEAEVPTALRKLIAQFPLRTAAITDGPDTAFLYEGGKLYAYEIPPLDQLINPIGSGDTANAVLAGELLAGTPVREAYAKALGAAVANCRSPVCGEYDPAEAAGFTAAIKITEQPF